MADQVYEMMAKIGLDATALMAGLAAFGLKLTGLTNQVEWLGTAMKGLAAALAVAEIVKGFERIAEAGKQVNHEISNMKQLGFTADEQVAAIAQAKQTAYNVPTTTFAENLKHLQELRFIMGDYETASKYLDSLSRMNDIIGNISEKNKDQIFDLAKTGEIKNLTPDPKEFMAFNEMMLKSIQASRGNITAAMFRNAIQYGRVGAMTWDKEFVGGALGRMIQEYSSSGGVGAAGGPGNALMSMYQAVVPGKMTKPAAAEWGDLGFDNIRHHGISKEQGRDLFLTNPYEWVQQYLMPALAAKGITSNNDISAKIGELFGVRTAAGIATNMALGGRYHIPGMNAEGKPNSPFEKDIGLQKLAEGEGAYGRLIKEDYPAIMKAFNAEWEHFLQLLGGELLKPGGPVIRAMAGLVTAFSSMDKFFADHPGLVDVILVAMAGLASGLAAFAVGAAIEVMTMLLPGGLIVIAIGGLVGALITMAAVNWDKIKMAADGISYFVSIVGSAMRMLGMLPKVPADKVDPNIHPQRFEGIGPGGGDRARMLPANFSPGNPKQVLQPITITLNMDGHQMAQAMSEALEDLYTHPTNSPQANGWDHFRPQGNFSDT